MKQISFEIRHGKQKTRYDINNNILQIWLKDLLKKSVSFYNWRPIPLNSVKELDGVNKVIVSCTYLPDGDELNLSEEEIDSAHFYHYSVKQLGPMSEEILANGSSEDAAIGSLQWELPCAEFDDLWEILVYSDEIKNDIMRYVLAVSKISESHANSAIIDVNRLFLFHGPPGTGKTSFCKALAQRLSISLSFLYKRSIFVEVNSHSLFSRWFSESGKLILKLFSEIEKLAEQSNSLIFVLIDEVESLTIGRSSAFSGNDPSDSVRAVNAVLTQLDKIKRYPNVFVLATSNISFKLDSAFTDRSDIIRYVGNPSIVSICKIFDTTVAELQRIGLIASMDSTELSKNANQISILCEGLSCRLVKKLPIIAYAKCCDTRSKAPIHLNTFYEALKNVVSEVKIKNGDVNTEIESN